MAVLRCPHCNKPNPDFLDNCQYCDQPLNAAPVAADTSQTTTPESPEPVHALTEWDAAEAEPPATQATAGDAALPNWLSALEDDAGSAPGTSAADPLPNWLSAIEAETDSATVSTPTAAVTLPDWLSDGPATGASDDQALGGSDALWTGTPADQPSSSQGTADRSASPPPEAALPDWLSAIQPAESPELAALPNQPDLPDWLRDEVELMSAAPASSASEGAAPGGPVPVPNKTDDLPDRLAGSDQAAATAQNNEPAQPASLDLAWPAASIGAEPFGRSVDDRPDWLAEITEPEPEAVSPDEPEPALPAGAPDWLQTLSPEQPNDRTTEPPILASPSNDPAGALPDTPLSRSSAPSLSHGAEQPLGRPDDLERAELPAWLSAMRPVEVQSAATPAGDDDQYEEAIGVLAGMRGVLRAEPSVVLPGKSATQVHTLTMTDSQARAAQVLAAIARAETGTADAKRKRRWQVPVLRWAITLALIAASLIPFAIPGLFMPPQTIGRMTEAAVSLVEGLDATGPVLVAIDYEPGQAGELDPAARALLRHLMRQGLPVVTVSTSPGGAGLAQRLLRSSARDYGLSEYTHFVNLGYIPGGPAGVLAFGVVPRTVFLADFSGSGAVWDSAAAQGVQQLNDFSAVIVISGSPETARAWIEQTERMLDTNKPFVIATSAAADPLLRPYTASVGGPVDGYLAGLGGVAQYEAKAGLTGAGQTRFVQIGALLWVAAAAIVFGNALAVLRHVRLKRQ